MNKNNNFEKYFSEFYKERWENIYDNLKTDTGKIARINKFCDSESIKQSVKNFKSFPNLEGCYISENYPDIFLCNNGLKPFYLMDPASVIPVLNMDIKRGDNVLDMCAAPGGKSLIIAEILNGTGMLTLNDISRKRIFKLKRVLKDYLPETILNKIKITNYDGTGNFFRKKQSFDRILLDAPCSAERHLIKNNNMIERWKISGSKRVAIKQYSLLSSALLSLKPGGTIVYSTCSLSELENDKIIKKLIKRHGDDVEVRYGHSPLGNRSKFGWLILPDKKPFGPIYFSIIKKIK